MPTLLVVSLRASKSSSFRFAPLRLEESVASILLRLAALVWPRFSALGPPRRPGHPQAYTILQGGIQSAGMSCFVMAT
jgi:hypothetical protein